MLTLSTALTLCPNLLTLQQQSEREKKALQRLALEQLCNTAAAQSKNSGQLVSSFGELETALAAAADAQRSHMQFLASLQTQVMQQNVKVATHVEALARAKDLTAQLVHSATVAD